MLLGSSLSLAISFRTAAQPGFEVFESLVVKLQGRYSRADGANLLIFVL